MKTDSEKKNNLFHSEFWTEVTNFLPDTGVLLVFLECSILLSSVVFFLYHRFFHDNIFVLLGSFSFLIIIGSFVCYRISTLEKITSSNLIDLEACRQCVEQFDNDSFFLAQYELIKAKSSPDNNMFEQTTLQSIEKSLESGDEVIIYTSLQGSEVDVIETVRANVKRGIKYSLIYYREHKLLETDKSLYSANIKINENNENIDYQLAKSNSGFDLFCYKKGNSNKIEAYFAVNYSVRDNENDNVCLEAAKGTCPQNDQCNVDNKYLFYKKLDNSIAEALFAKFSGIISRGERSGSV